jgi:hypothetical protein
MDTAERLSSLFEGRPKFLAGRLNLFAGAQTYWCWGIAISSFEPQRRPTIILRLAALCRLPGDV